MMSRRKVFLYVVVSLIVVAVLVAGGYALYRLGYAHGIEGTRVLGIERRWMPDFDRRMVPDLWHSRGYVGFPFGVIPGIFSGLIFVTVIALAVYGGVKLFFPESRNRGHVPESRVPQSEPPVEGSPPAT